MAPGISYDESGSLANYFGVTFLVLVLVPTTYAVLRPDKKGESNEVTLHVRSNRLTPQNTYHPYPPPLSPAQMISASPSGNEHSEPVAWPSAPYLSW